MNPDSIPGCLTNPTRGLLSQAHRQDDIARLTRELDVLLNGEAGAAPQASLCDIVGQVAQAAAKIGRPVLAPQQAAPVVRLQWSIDTPPSDACWYDHCTAESPLGPFRIEWKSWKEHDSHCLYLNGEYLGCASTTDAAKQLAQDHIAALARQLAPYQHSEAPQQAAPSGDAESLLRDAREALWQPSNPEICKRIDNFLDAARKEGK